MLRTLIRKQFMELFAGYFQNRKTGKKRSKLGIIGYFILFIIIMGYLFGVFFFIASQLAGTLLQPGFMAGNRLDWLYYALMSVIAILLGAFGSVFNTYTALYKAKDNELLLSMPIPPSKLLISRMVAAYGMSFLYGNVVWAPTILAAWFVKLPSVTGILYSLLLVFIIPILITVLVCILGWGVAVVSDKLKNRNIITVIVSLVFFMGYYYVCMNLNGLLTSVLTNSDQLAVSIKARIYPLYQLGLAATGDTPGFVIFTMISLVSFVLCCYVMSRSFIRIATAKHGVEKRVYVEKTAKGQKASEALVGKELRHFLACPAYMLNCGLGLFISLVAAVAVIIKAESIRETIDMLLFKWEWTALQGMLPMLVAAAACMLISTNAISAPSVSLEGKAMWILRSLPVTEWQILQAKESMCVRLNMLPAMAFSAAACWGVRLSLAEALLVLGITGIFVQLSADMGLYFGTIWAKFNWTSETYPIKQSLSVFLNLFGGWVVGVLIPVLGYLLGEKLGTVLALCLIALLLGLFTILFRYLLKKHGCKVLAGY